MLAQQWISFYLKTMVGLFTKPLQAPYQPVDEDCGEATDFTHPPLQLSYWPSYPTLSYFNESNVNSNLANRVKTLTQASFQAQSETLKHLIIAHLQYHNLNILPARESRDMMTLEYVNSDTRKKIVETLGESIIFWFENIESATADQKAILTHYGALKVFSAYFTNHHIYRSLPANGSNSPEQMLACAKRAAAKRGGNKPQVIMLYPAGHSMEFRSLTALTPDSIDYRTLDFLDPQQLRSAANAELSLRTNGKNLSTTPFYAQQHSIVDTPSMLFAFMLAVMLYPLYRCLLRKAHRHKPSPVYTTGPTIH
jgi:hypothetical protein